jgi:hypothetical protein
MTSTFDQIKQHLDMMHSVEERIWTVTTDIPGEKPKEHTLHFFVDKILDISTETKPRVVRFHANIAYLSKLPERIALDTAMLIEHLKKLPKAVGIGDIDYDIFGYTTVETEMQEKEPRYCVRVSFEFDEVLP